MQGSNSRPFKRDDPTPYVSGYELHVYCDHVDPVHPDRMHWSKFPAYTKKQAFDDARRSGWIIRIDGSSTCPACCKALGLGKFKARRNGNKRTS